MRGPRLPLPSQRTPGVSGYLDCPNARRSAAPLGPAPYMSSRVTLQNGLLSAPA